ncbi:hypothetical protein ACIQNU_03645 [Streptomyces sp. NPDC091292]|uniref:hypothetical protein n=1 Tax=Streptomyces sp. NPDC091292 TaxID=3365991 RepID=UPI00381A80E4
MNGHELTAWRFDIGQQGWLIVGGVAVVGLLGLVWFLRRADSHGSHDSHDRALLGPIVGVLALTVVGVVLAGRLGLLIPVLALLAGWRRGLLVPIAFVAMAAAGFAGAMAASGSPSLGGIAFGPVTQLLVVVALFAVLLVVGRGAAPWVRGRRAASSTRADGVASDSGPSNSGPSSTPPAEDPVSPNVGPVPPNPLPPGLVAPDPVTPHPVRPVPPEPAAPKPVIPEPIASGPTISARAPGSTHRVPAPSGLPEAPRKQAFGLGSLRRSRGRDGDGR